MQKNWFILLLVLISTLPINALDLSGQGISDLCALELKEGVRKIDLSQNLISDLSCLDLPSSTEKLNLSQNQFVNLSNLTLNDTLKTLIISDNSLETIHGLTLPNTLQTLLAEACNIASMDTVSYPNSLKLLSFAVNDLTEFNGDLLSNLDHLNIGANNFDRYSQVKLPSKLKTLSIGGINHSNDFSDLLLPETLETLVILRSFLSNEDLATLNLPNQLRKLDLRKNLLTNIDSLVLPESVRVLDLRKNFISSAEERRILRRFRDHTQLRIIFGKQK